jgi:uncharacterized protein
MKKENLLAGKKIYDAVHGFIKFDEFERIIIDSIVFQRLHYIRQLGIAYLVYPGATHSRFEHSLGTMELATRMFKRICTNVRPDVFQQIPRKGSAEYLYWKKILRIAALCHDLGHLPFSHVSEKGVADNFDHEYWSLKIIQSPYLKDVWEKLQKKTNIFVVASQRDIVEDIVKIAIGEEKLKLFFPKKDFKFSSWERVLSTLITGDFFGADRIDYLLRDANSTGIAYGLFDYLQLIESLCVLPSKKKNEMQLGINEKGIESCEALSLARHFMFKRVYEHSTVKAYSFHLRRFLKHFYFKHDVFKDLKDFLYTNDSDVIHALHAAAKDLKEDGYKDANIVINRKNHFKAICLPADLNEEDLISFKLKNKLKDDQIYWEINNQLKKEKELSFPVSKRNLSIINIKQCSTILSNLPNDLNNWLYITPEYELLFVQKFKI